jgi:hypothetical protein
MHRSRETGTDAGRQAQEGRAIGIQGEREAGREIDSQTYT